MDADAPPPISRRGPCLTASPVVIAVPHAGRHYDRALTALARLPQERLAALEDRHAERLVDDAAADGAAVLIATTPRAWIDLNRDPREVDPAMVEPPARGGWRDSAKLRGGLGLIPRRIAAGEIWRRPLSPREVADRIADVHRPWHAAIADALDAAQARFGHALLIDCHSMPPLPGPQPPRIVLGDRFGASAARGVLDAMARAATAYGRPPAINRPYAGGYALERHGCPAKGRHAMQVEFCRTLYLDAALDDPGVGLTGARSLLAALARAGADALGWPQAIAAE